MKVRSRGSIRELLASLRLPLPLVRKLPLVIQNRLRALVLGGCCGHPRRAGLLKVG